MKTARTSAATFAACVVVGTLAGPCRAEATTSAEPVPSDGSDAVPKGRTGFQAALRTGYALPFGKWATQGSKAIGLAGSGSMSDAFGGQVPFIADIGGKLIPALFLGAYFGMGVGGTDGKLSNGCADGNVRCTTATVRVGAEALYGFNPTGLVNPWVGYGIGYESTSYGMSGTTVTTVSGLEFAHLMGGADFRLGKIFGIGPFVDVSLGEYTHAALGSGSTSEGPISDTALHGWFTFGVRGVFWP